MEEPIDLESLFPDRSCGEPLGSQLVRRLRTAIKSGFFAAGSRLLATRELAKRLGISRNTVTEAFEQLIAEGYLEARVGAGTFVTETLRETRKGTAAPSGLLPAVPSALTAIKESLDAVGSSFGPLRVGAPDLSAFPRGCGSISSARISPHSTRIWITVNLPGYSPCVKRLQAISRSFVG